MAWRRLWSRRGLSMYITWQSGASKPVRSFDVTTRSCSGSVHGVLLLRNGSKGNGNALKLFNTRGIEIRYSSVIGNGPNSSAAVATDNGSEALITYSNFVRNGTALENLDNGYLIRAENNFWASFSGPFHPQNIEGSGDTVSASVDR